MDDPGKTETVWARGDTAAGISVHPAGDGLLLRLWAGGEQADLPLEPTQVIALRDALASCLSPAAASGPSAAPAATATKVPTGPRGPSCDRCKAITVQIRDGYRCEKCGNEIIWL